MATEGCSHLVQYKQDPSNRESYKWIHSVFVVGAAGRLKKTRICNSYCRVCKERGPFLHACLDCVFFGCLSHIREHQKTSKHYLSVDLTYGQIFCFQCVDYIYDAEIDYIGMSNKMEAGAFRKRLFESTSWDASSEERDFLKNKTRKLCLSKGSNIGLRGLFNLGKTCYMNCVVQALMHTPVLRDYFMVQRPHMCKKKIEICLICEITNLYQEFYKGSKTPLAMHQLLNYTWRNIDNFKKQSEQDAHEFLVKILNLLHTHFSESMVNKSSSPTKQSKCSCIIDQIFVGGLQDELSCKKCDKVRMSDVIVTIFSLDIIKGPGPYSLETCLDVYTSAEDLTTQLKCSYCDSYQNFSKRFTIKVLPIVICFQLKRYDTSCSMRKKVSTYKNTTIVSFPEIVDMSPFMSKPKKESPFPVDNKYTLYAVISHVGKGKALNEGHYITYVRQQDSWWECNDTAITRIDVNEVLSSQGYLLFYHKRVLGYN